MKHRHLALCAALVALTGLQAKGSSSPVPLSSGSETLASPSTALINAGQDSDQKPQGRDAKKGGDGPYGRESRQRNQERRKQQTERNKARTQGAGTGEGESSRVRGQNKDKGGPARVNAESNRAREQRQKRAAAARSSAEKEKDEAYEKRLEEALNKDTAGEGDEAARIEAAREANTAKATRISNARLQYTQAERAERISRARKDLADLDEGQLRTVKRFLLEQEKHIERLARLDRVGRILEGKDDQAALNRVEALRSKEKASFENFKASMRKALSDRQASAVESAGLVGTRPVKYQKLDGRKAQKMKSKAQTEAPKSKL